MQRHHTQQAVLNAATFPRLIFRKSARAQADSKSIRLLIFFGIIGIKNSFLLATLEDQLLHENKPKHRRSQCSGYYESCSRPLHLTDVLLALLSEGG